MTRFKFSLLVSVIVSLQFSTNVCQTNQDDAVVGGYYRPGTTALQILRARGYLAQEFFIRSDDNYRLSIVRARNPLIGATRLALREPILFIHGGFMSAAGFVTNSAGARPRDFTNIQVRGKSLEQLVKLVGNDPGSFSMPTLFLNFGYEVWLLNKRGTLESHDLGGRTLLDALSSILPSLFGGGFGPNTISGISRRSAVEPDLCNFDVNGTSRADLPTTNMADRRYDEFLQPFVNLPGALFAFGSLIGRIISSFEPSYWRYSLDEQASFDVKASVDFVLHMTGKRKLNYVGFSEGGAMMLMKLSETPQFADKGKCL